jgi:hypothetical protein
MDKKKYKEGKIELYFQYFWDSQIQSGRSLLLFYAIFANSA